MRQAPKMLQQEMTEQIQAEKNKQLSLKIGQRGRSLPNTMREGDGLRKTASKGQSSHASGIKANDKIEPPMQNSGSGSQAQHMSPGGVNTFL